MRSSFQCRVLTGGSLLAASAIAAPVPAAADDSFPVGNRPVALAAGGDKLVYVASGSAAQPKEGFGANSRTLPGTGRGTYRGIDVGSDRGGGSLLVYSRCGRTCDLFSYSFGSGRERLLGGPSSGACHERNPRLERGVLTFTRVGARGARRRCRSGLYLQRPGRRSRRVIRSVPRDHDYAGGVFALAVAFEDEGGNTVTEILLRRLGRRGSSLVWRASEEDEGLGNFVQGPQLDGGFVYWWEIDRSLPLPGQQLPAGADGRGILRRPVRGRAVTGLERDGRLFTGPVKDTLRGFALAGDRLYYAYGSSPVRIGLVEPPPPPFTRPVFGTALRQPR